MPRLQSPRAGPDRATARCRSFDERNGTKIQHRLSLIAQTLDQPRLRGSSGIVYRGRRCVQGSTRSAGRRRIPDRTKSATGSSTPRTLRQSKTPQFDMKKQRRPTPKGAADIRGFLNIGSRLFDTARLPAERGSVPLVNRNGGVWCRVTWICSAGLAIP